MPEPPDSQVEKPSHVQLLFRLLNEIGIIDQLSAKAFERLLPHGLTRAQFSVLNHCMRLGDNKTPAQLAESFQVTRGTMTSTLARLEQKGFIRLEPDAVDGRSKRVMLTRKGRAAREDSVRVALPFLSEATSVITRDMVERMLPQIELIRAWLDQNRLD
ncbi:MAG: MarR family winged helix-turn-helix transcriptional regulator [Alphaproteobacteria bacterium]